MNTLRNSTILILVILLSYTTLAQTDSLKVENDSLNEALFQNFNQKIREIEQQRIADSVKKAES